LAGSGTVNEVLSEIILWYRYNFEKCESGYSVDLSLVPKGFLGIIVLMSLNFAERTVKVLAWYRWLQLFGCISIIV